MMSLSNVVSQKRSFFRKHRFMSNHHHQQQNNSSSFDCEECPICWGAMPSNPKVLPCGHVFCRKCIKDLVQYQEEHNPTDGEACCPMCRGPLTVKSAKQLYQQAKSHELNGYHLYHMQQSEVRISAANRFLLESQQEYRQAVSKLEECWEVLKLQQQQSDRDDFRSTTNHHHHRSFIKSSRRRRDAKLRHQQINKVLCKLIELLPLARYNDSDERTISFLRTLLKETKIPMPHMHLKLAKLLHRQSIENNDNENDNNNKVQQVMEEYQRILDIATSSSAKRISSSRRQAKKLQGQAHYGLARCHHQLGNYKRACREYRTACEQQQFASSAKLQIDYGLVAECFYQIGHYAQAMDYASMQLRKEEESCSNNNRGPTIETLLLLAKICHVYFCSFRTTKRGKKKKNQHDNYYYDFNALEYQSRCEIYRQCICNARVLARHELHRRECAKHVAFLHHLLYYPTTTTTTAHRKKQRGTIIRRSSSYMVDDDDDDESDDEDSNISYDDDDDEDLETEECDTEISVEL